MQKKKIRIEINSLIFDSKFSFNAHPNTFVTRRGVRVMHEARLCQGRALVFRAVLVCFGSLFLAIQNLIMLSYARVV